MTPRGTLLVADFANDRVAEVDLEGDGYSFVRVLGAGVVTRPKSVDCSHSVIVVLQNDAYVVVLSAVDGGLITRLGAGAGCGPGQLSYPSAVCVLCDGSGVVAASLEHRRLVVFGMDGGVQLAAAGLAEWAPG